MKARKNIAWYEVVPKRIWEKYKNFERGMMRLLDDRILNFGQWFIERHGTCYLNNWYWGGIHDSRGWRPTDDPDGSKLSQHKFGRALDLIPKYKTIIQIHIDIIRNEEEYLNAGITTVECIWDATSWMHFDNRSHDMNGIMFVDYSGNAYNKSEYEKELRKQGYL
jgi:hypothetical protein